MRIFPTLVSEGAADYAGRVRVLSPEVAHRIAAGEVIERPASAVKELIENSLDAGASRVEVEIESGGMALIRVSDDGSGMPPEDAARAVTEHATSKIRTADDLASVISLGFRGEALHAIGAVSDLTLTTRKRGTEGSLGARVRVFAGEVGDPATAAHPPGTTVEARDLFLNLPGFPRHDTGRGERGSDGDRVARHEPSGGRVFPPLGRTAFPGFPRGGRSQGAYLPGPRSLASPEPRGARGPCGVGFREPTRPQLPDPPLPARRGERPGHRGRLLRPGGREGLR
jgi:hypothetical protein